MFKELSLLLNNAYAEYSHYRVASIVETDKGIFSGTNVENAVYPLSRCAEQVAVCNAVAAGARVITKLYLLTDSENGYGTPCGACRQVMAEFMTPESEIIIYNKAGECYTTTIADLLPAMWHKGHLNNQHNNKK